MTKRLALRYRRMLKFLIISFSLIAAASLYVWMSQPEPEVYVPGDRVEGITKSLDRELPKDLPTLALVEVAQESGIHFVHFWKSRSTQLPEDMGSGAAWGDYDNDGDLDLYICNIAGPLRLSAEEIARSPASNKLYRNKGDGTFSDVTASSGVGFKGCSMAAAWADYDGDGDLDLLVTNFGSNVLYRNDGNGRFSDVTQTSGLGSAQGFWAGASWADYDRDGDLDVYICGYVKYHFDPADSARAAFQYKAAVPFTINPSSYPPERNLLYRNERDGTFTEVAVQAGVDNPAGRSLSASWCDFDLDGWLDLYVANDISDNVMFKNAGDGTFADISHAAWVADYRGAMGLAVSDWDNDGDFDIFITHWIAQENAFYNNLLYTPANPKSKAEKMLFMDIADQVGLGQIALDYIGWGTSFFDYDNDGKEDLFVVNGSTFQDEKRPAMLVPMRNLLFQNRGEEDGFFEVGSASGAVFRRERVGRGAAFADYDNDGDVDVLVVNHSHRASLLRNEGGNRKNWIKIKVRAAGKNRFGVGAIVEVLAGGQKQTQQLGAQSSYLSQNPLEAHFGLEKFTQVDSLRVIFPSGQSREIKSVAANQTVTVDEAKR